MPIINFYLLLLFLSTLQPIHSLNCNDLTVHDLTELDSTFRECGVALYPVDTAPPSLISFARVLIDSPELEENVFTFQDINANFSKVIRPALSSNELGFEPPSILLLIISISNSVDCEICFSNLTPCRPRKYRFLELETHDILFIDPMRVS